MIKRLRRRFEKKHGFLLVPVGTDERLIKYIKYLEEYIIKMDKAHKKTAKSKLRFKEAE